MATYDDYLQRGSTPTYDSNDNASALLPEEVSRDIIKSVTEKSAVMAMARKRRMSRAQVRMPVLAVKPTAEWVDGDQGLKSTTEVAWNNIFLNVAELAIIVPVSENLLADTDVDLWAEIRPEIEEAFAVKIDEAVLFGINKPSQWPDSIAEHAIAAGNTVSQGAGVDIAADVNNVLAAVEADGFVPDGIAMRQALRASFRGLRSTTNEFIFQPNNPGAENTTFGRREGGRVGRIFDVEAHAIMNGAFETHNTASANASSLIAGDWDQVIIGIRQDMTAKRFDTGVIQDANGAITFNLLQQDMVAMRFVLRMAYAMSNPLNRMSSVEANRSPFAVLRDAA